MDREVIIRVWHGRTAAEDADSYLDFITRVAVPDYRSVQGNLSVEIWRRREGAICHFWTVTRWESYDSITRFAGEDIEKAKYYPEDTSRNNNWRCTASFRSNSITL